MDLPTTAVLTDAPRRGSGAAAVVYEDIRLDSTIPVSQELVSDQHMTETNYDVTLDMNLINLNVFAEEEMPPNSEEYPFNGYFNDPSYHNLPFLDWLQRSSVGKYFYFLFFFLLKAVIDHISAILALLLLFISFCYFNALVKREVAKQSQRNIGFLLFAISHLALTIFLFYFFYKDPNLHFGLIFVSQYDQSITTIYLLLSTALNDYILKLITISVKIICMLLPTQFLPIIKRGNVYLLIETTSQLYRLCVTIHPWMFFLFASCQDSNKLLVVLLPPIYFVIKITDLVTYVKELWTALYKLVHNTDVTNSVPTKELLTIAGTDCPICQGEYVEPVLMQCHHIFCADCISRWLITKNTCPLCRTKLIDNQAWRDGSTARFIQIV